jgi:hypothetical protein
MTLRVGLSGGHSSHRRDRVTRFGVVLRNTAAPARSALISFAFAALFATPFAPSG